MGIITEISMQQRNKKRVNLHIDGEFVCGLDAFTVLSYGLKVGGELSDKELLDIQLASDGEAAFSKAANYLGIRMRSKNEIIRYLTGKGYSNAVIYNVLEKLIKYKYVDDETFVNEYVKSTSKTRSARRIKADLMRMGAPQPLVEERLEDLEGQDEAALRAAVKYTKRRGFDRNKLGAYLAGKGFDWDVIRTAVAAVESGEDGDDKSS